MTTTLPGADGLETDAGASAASAPPSPPAERSVEISPIPRESVLSLLFPSNLQIERPQRLAPATLRLFRDQGKQIMLVPYGSKRIWNADLGVVTETFLLAYARDAAALKRYSDDVLLVIFPVRPGERYVLQTSIEDVDRDSVRLRYQDPRFDSRWKVEARAMLSVAPLEFPALVQAHHVDLSREVTGLAGERPPTGAGAIVDRAQAVPAGAAYPALALFEATSALHGEAVDIALGGACLALEKRRPREQLANRIVRFDVELPAQGSQDPGAGSMALRLSLLGMVRDVRESAGGCTVHIRFLKRLPSELDTRFEALSSPSEEHPPRPK
jgi:hypothetical protein